MQRLVIKTQKTQAGFETLPALAYSGFELCLR